MAVIREQRQFKIGPVGVARASEGGRIIGEAISNSANQLAGDFFKMAAVEAEKTGTEAGAAVTREQVITIDPRTGKPEAFVAPEGFGRTATEAYQRVVMRRFQQSYDDEIQNKAKELSVKYENNPNGVSLYETEMSDYMAAMSNEAEGSFKTYIQDVGTTYLNATKTNLAAAQIRRERTAAATSQALAVENGYESIEGLIAQIGPSALEGATQTNSLIQQVENTVNDGVNSGLFDSSALSSMSEGKQLAVTRGLIRYATNKTNDPETLQLLQQAIGTQNAASVPKEFSYVAYAMIEMGSNYSALSQLEKFSDGLLSDAVQRANVIQAQEVRQIEAAEAISVFDMEQNMIASISNAVDIARDARVPPATIAVYSVDKYNQYTDIARNALRDGKSDLSKTMLENRDKILDGTVEGLMLRAVSGLSKKETNQLEKAIFDKNPLLAPQSSQQSLQALISLDSKVDPKILEDFLPFIGSYRDSTAKYIDSNNKAGAASQAKTFQFQINNLKGQRGAFVGKQAQSMATKISKIKNITPALAESYSKEIQFAAAQAKVSEYFEKNPSEESATDAATYLAGGKATNNLRPDQIALLNDARQYAAKSGREGEVRTHFNTNATRATKRRNLATKRAEEYRNLKRIELGQGDPTSQADREIVEKALELQLSPGVLLSSFWSNPELMQTKQGQAILNATGSLSVMPQSLHESLSSFANGNFLGGSPSALLSHYTNFRDYEYGGTSMRSVMMQSLGEDQVAMLDYLAASARGGMGSDPEFLARAFKAKSEFESNPAYKERVEAFLGSSLSDYVSQIDGIQDAPLQAVDAMKAATLDLMGISQLGGLSKSALTDTLERQLKSRYPSGGGIVIGPNGALRTSAPLSYAAPRNEDLLQEYIIGMVTEAEPDAERPEFGGDVGAIEFTASVIAAGRVPLSGNIFLKPVGVPTQGLVQYAVFRRTTPEQGGYRQINTMVDVAGINGKIESVPAPLIISNQDEKFLKMVSSRKAREESQAIYSGKQKFNAPRQKLTSSLYDGTVISGGGGGFGGGGGLFSPRVGTMIEDGPIMVLN